MPLLLLRCTWCIVARSAFGITLWEMYTGGRAFEGVPCALLGHQITREHKRPRFPDSAPWAYRDLAERCWQPNWQERCVRVDGLRVDLGAACCCGLPVVCLSSSELCGLAVVGALQAAGLRLGWLQFEDKGQACISAPVVNSRHCQSMLTPTSVRAC